MDWEMALAIATLFSVAGWFVFKVLAWRREKARNEEAAKNDAARDAEAAKNDAARDAEAAKNDAARDAEAAKNDAARELIEARLGAVERGQAAIMAELGGIKETLGRFFRTQEADHAMLVELKAETAGLRSSIDNLYRLHREGMEVHGREIAALGDRIGALEARVGCLERKVDGLEEKVSGLERDLAALKSEFAEFREAVMPRARSAGAAA